MSVASGGSFKQGFVSAGFAKFTSGFVPDDLGGRDTWSGLGARTGIAAAAGGTGSVLAYGRWDNDVFRDGAMTGAFSRLFNDEHTVRMAQKEWANTFRTLGTFLGITGEAASPAAMPMGNAALAAEGVKLSAAARLAAPVGLAVTGAAAWGLNVWADYLDPHPSGFGSSSQGAAVQGIGLMIPEAAPAFSLPALIYDSLKNAN